MAETYWPFENADTTETQYSQLMRRLQSTGVWGSTADSALKVYADSSGMQVKLNPGFAFILGYAYSNDNIPSTKTLAVALGESQARIDAVVLRMDPAANSITPMILKGTAAADPQIPALTQTDAGVYDLLLAAVSVGANASTLTASAVADARTFMGHIFGLWETSNRPASPRPGQPGFNLTTNKPEIWDGTVWTDFLPDQIAASAITGVLATSNIPNLDAGKITTGTLSSDRLPTVPVAKGGTGANDSYGALSNLGAARESHSHDASDVNAGTLNSARLPTVPINKGGTGSTDVQSARLALGLPSKVLVQQADPGVSGQPEGALWFSW